MTETCTNITCEREATTEIKFGGVPGTHPYCDEHAKELKEMHEGVGNS